MRIRRALPALLAAFSAGAGACEATDDLAGAPWRTVVARIKYLPQTEAWAKLMEHERNVVQYVVLMGEPKYIERRCYWPVEVRADGKLWKRFLVTPDGKNLIEEKPR